MVIKLAGISALLAGIFVVAIEVPSAQSRTTAKLHYDRVESEPAPAAGMRVAQAQPMVTRASTGDGAPDCSRQAWPYVDPACVSTDRKPVRTITIERREAPDSSTLVRVPIHTN